MPSQNALIAAADDLGLSAATDRAILGGLAEGWLTAADLMATAPDAHALAKRVADAQGEIGWHVNLSDDAHCAAHKSAPEENPRSGAQSLTDAWGRFLGRTAALAALTAPTPDLKAWIRAELQAQLNVFLESGAHITHISGHHHLHVLPVVRHTLIDLFRDRGLKPPVVRGFGASQSRNPIVFAMLTAHGRSALQDFEAAGWTVTRLVGFRWVDSPCWQSLAAELGAEHARPADRRPLEWMLHVADGPGTESLSLKRGAEWSALRTIHTGGCLASAGYHLVRCSELT